MQVLYFAWLRERIGAASEEIDAGDARTPRELIERLAASEPRYARAFEDIGAIRVALDQEMAELDAAIGEAREIAFFPPVTGG